MADLIIHNAKICTLDPTQPDATALAISHGKFVAVGTDREVLRLAAAGTQTVDARSKRVIPGLIDSHIHVIRGGLNFNLELRWDGVPSLADAMRLLENQVAQTPSPQWVRVVGGFCEHQFAERRLPTIDELNAVAPETPVFILHLYDRALLNRAALRAVGYTKKTPDPPGSELVRDKQGNPTGLLLAKPNAMLLYATLAKGPRLPLSYQANSTIHFMRELNRLGVTSVVDAGGGFQNYPDDYLVIEELHRQKQLTLRIAYNLFTQHPGGELADFGKWVDLVRPGDGDNYYRHNGAGEMLVFSAADFEDFRQPRPDLAQSMESHLQPVVRHLVEHRWPFRLHATYDESIGRMLDVFERVDREIPFNGLRWFFDHAETISDRNMERVARLGGGIAIQHRMAYQGEYFAERYGSRLTERTPPFKRMLDMGIKVGAGTDATRVASYDPWTALYWLTTGKTVGGLGLYPKSNLVGREMALRLYTEANTWFSGEDGIKGRIATGQLADLAILSEDYFEVPDSLIRQIVSRLTIVGGSIVHADGEFGSLAPPSPPVLPDWSPTAIYTGYRKSADARAPIPDAGVHSCALHGRALSSRSIPGSLQGFWGPTGCACWAF